jgi:hypothetical protein
MKAYAGVNVQIHIFLTSPLDSDELSASLSGRFTPEEETRYPLYRRLGGTQSRSGRRGKN